jgi:hypothetical protein
MGIIGKDYKYLKIENFIDSKFLKILEQYTTIKHRLPFNVYKDKSPNAEFFNYETSVYGDPLMETILLDKKNHVEQLTGKELLPTYSFWRIYTNCTSFPVHTDRESCEISVTFNIASNCEAWPITMDGEPIFTNPGEAVIYLGREVKHGREKELKGEYLTQCFLHYVDKNGPYASFEKDKRPAWGYVDK